MKKLFVIVFTVLLTSTAFAQGLDIGIKAGVNFATINGGPDVSSITGFLAGGFATIKFSDKIAIQGDLLYSQQGAEFDAGEFKLDYINVPIVFKYYLVKRLVTKQNTL